MGSTRLGEYHSAAHEPWVAMSPLNVERQGDHPRVSGNLKHVWVCGISVCVYVHDYVNIMRVCANVTCMRTWDPIISPDMGPPV